MQIDRSRILSAQRCPRERYLAYHHLGSGIQKKSKGLPLQFGSAFHLGTEALLMNPPVEGVHDGFIEVAVEQAREFLAYEFAKHQVSFDGETPDDVQKAMEYGQEEQMALAEGLLRGWWAYEGKSFLNTFEVVEVEKEGRAVLGPTTWTFDIGENGNRPKLIEDDNDLVLMFRPDAVVREKATGDHYVVSWKTASTFSSRNLKQAKTDMQSLSEVFGVVHQRGISIEGVLYKYAIKGQRRLDKYDGLYKQGSHLCYGWVKLDTLKTDFPEWSWSYEWEKEDGSGSSRLGKGWQKKPIWRDYPGGVKQWIEDLSANQVFPRHIDALQAVFPQSLPVERRKDEVESWVRQTVNQEKRIEMSLEAIESISGSSDDMLIEASKHMLDVHFPQYTSSCHSYSGCSFIPICWEGAPAEVGEIYQIRSANHPEGKGDDE